MNISTRCWDVSVVWLLHSDQLISPKCQVHPMFQIETLKWSTVHTVEWIIMKPFPWPLHHIMQMPNKSYRESVTLSLDSCYVYGKYKVEHVRMDLEDQTAEIYKIILVFIAMVIVMTYVHQEVLQKGYDSLMTFSPRPWDMLGPWCEASQVEIPYVGISERSRTGGMLSFLFVFTEDCLCLLSKMSLQHRK